MSKMEHFAKIVNDWNTLTISEKRSFLDVWQSSEYAMKVSYLLNHNQPNELQNHLKYIYWIEKNRKSPFFIFTLSL